MCGTHALSKTESWQQLELKAHIPRRASYRLPPGTKEVAVGFSCALETRGRLLAEDATATRAQSASQ